MITPRDVRIGSLDARCGRVNRVPIYQAIDVHLHGTLKREIARNLRRWRAARKARSDPNARRPRFVDPITLIKNRPVEVEDRTVPGHWEGDLIIGAAGGSAIVTLVEWSSRLVLLGHVGKERNDQRAPNDEVDVVPIRPGQRIERHSACAGLINEYRPAA